MRHKKLILALTLLTLIIAAILPLLLCDKSETINQTLSNSATLVAPLATVFTLIIAIMLYNKFGIEPKFIEEQARRVFALLEEIQLVKFIIENKDYSFYIEMIHPDLPLNVENLGQARLLFSNDYLHSLQKIFDLCQNPIIPKDVSWRIQLLKCEYILFVQNGEDYFKIFADNSILPLGKKRFGLFNGEERTLGEFLNITAS